MYLAANLASVRIFLHCSPCLNEYSDKPIRNHLKNVYSTLALALLAAAVGSYIHVATDLLKVVYAYVVRE